MPSIGLTSAEAAQRRAAGQGNDIALKTSRSFADIFQANFLNLANVILLSIVTVLVLVGRPGDAMFTGGVVVINIVIGTVQEYRSKIQLDRIALLTRPKVTVLRDGSEQQIDQTEVVVGDAILFRAGDQAVVDGRMIQNPDDPDAKTRVDVDESALTGESDLIPKRPDDEILSGCFAVVGEGIYIAERVGNDSFAAKITLGAREYTRVITPLQRQISVIVRVLVVLAVALSIMLGLAYAYQSKPFSDGVADAAVVISLIPQGLLLMITVAYALGALRIARQGALVQQMNAVESISNVDVLCLDKTGTLTTNRILFNAVHPLNGHDEAAFKDLIGSYILSTGAKNRTSEAIAEALAGQAHKPSAEIPFSSARKWSGASFTAGLKAGTYILGAPEMMIVGLGEAEQKTIQNEMQTLAEQGLRVLLFAHSGVLVKAEDIPEDHEPDLPADLSALGLISFSDELRPNVGEVLEGFRKAKITLKVISGDNPDTVAALAYQAGFSPEHDKAISGMALAEMSAAEFDQAAMSHTIFGRITPEQKRDLVDVLRAHGHYVAMMGDGVNDVLSLKRAQVGIAMEDGSQATRSVADIVLLGNKFEVLPQAFIEGQRILNGMNDSMRLFLTRTMYAALLIILMGFIGTEFPFTPRQNALLTSLPVGMPAFFLAYWAKSGQPKKSLMTTVSEFVIPAGFSLFVVASFIWILYVTYGVASLETGRTVLTTAGLIGGLFVIVLAQHEREDWQTGKMKKGDPRRVLLALAMLILFGLLMSSESVRTSFDMTTLSWADMATIGAAMAVWAGGLWLLLRYDLMERVLIPDYKRDNGEDLGQEA